MKNRPLALQKLAITLIQTVVLTLSGLPAYANNNGSGNSSATGPRSNINSANPRPQQTFMSTTPLNTPEGTVHIEVQSYDIHTAEDLNRARQEILAKTRQQPETNEFFRIEVKTTDARPQSLETPVKNVATEIENSIRADNKSKPAATTVAPPNAASFFKRNYNMTLSFVRFVANTAVVSSGLVIGAGVPMEHALLIGSLAGAMSGAIQLKSDVVMKWLANSVLMVNTAKRLRLLPANDGLEPARAERAMREVEMYSRWAMLETGFLLVIRTSMSLLNIPVTENLFMTVAKSTASQGIFEVGVLKATQQLERMNPNWSSQASVFKNVALFTGSGVSVLAAIGSMVGMPFANLGFVVLTGTGLVLNFAPKLSKSRTVERILSGWRPTGAVKTCRSLFAY
ncbi:hypothetical protein [Pseudobdellovibrio exovorus]|uniref:Uncharacterized protein n=1 Tax=Pseudobdellovibrio exovorus JSS TaxID=1184267 RepID=M4V5U2_9BACT|nr:hypothetical protein [Pseudobdellovibrio exovorus]AGH94538.1 hypothetical protein A11Q_318 [Pseudobdellovibrio exovorus JSS]